MMQVFSLITLLFVLSGFSGRAQIARQSGTVLERILAEARKQYAPDKRTEVLELDTAGQVLLVESTCRAALDYIRQELDKQDKDVRLETVLLPSAELEGRIYGVANLSVSNHRFRPGHAAELVTQTLLGTPLEVLKRQDGYYLVSSPDRYISWIDAAGLVLMNEGQFQEWKSSEKLVFMPSAGRAYSKPHLESTPVSDLVAGNILLMKGRRKKFYEVAFPDGRRAFVPAKELMPYTDWLLRANPQPDDILATARRFIGLPYLWGGTSMKGVDCSGFTKTCFYLNGILIARDASQQALYGEPVDIHENGSVSLEKCLKNLQPGDLLFFAAKAPAPGARVTHTAIYLGDGEFIQSAGMVKISSLLQNAANYDAYHGRTLVSARRVLSSVNSEGISRIDQHPHYQTQ